MPRGKSTLKIGHVPGVGEKLTGRKFASGSGADWQKEHQKKLKREENAWEEAKKKWKSQRKRGYV